MDKINHRVRGSSIISSLNQKHIDEGFPGTEIGLPIDRPNCEGKVITRDDKQVDSITLRPQEWCWFYSKDGIKYAVHNVRGKMRVYKDGDIRGQVKPTKEMLKSIKIETKESTGVSGIATPTGRLHPEKEIEESKVKEAEEESEEDTEGEEEQEPEEEPEETEDSTEDETEKEDDKKKENNLHTGIIIDKDGKRKVKCPECGSFNVNIHDNGSTFHCVDCGYEWSTKDVDDDGYEDEKEQKDDILVQKEEEEEDSMKENESKVIEAVEESVDMKKRVKIYYDNVNKADFNRYYGKFLDKLNKYLKISLGSKEDGFSDNLKAYIECSEIVGQGMTVDLYIYGYRDEYEEDEKSKSELAKIIMNGTKVIKKFVGDYFDRIAVPKWNAKIEMRGKTVEVGPHIYYRWGEKEMNKVIGERTVIEAYERNENR